jgi:hypothetical protein
MTEPCNSSERSTYHVAPDELVTAMEQETRHYLQGVMEAVNKAPDGAWISGSEEAVRNLTADYRRRAFERAVQMRVDAAEAAFPPSGQSKDGQASGE